MVGVFGVSAQCILSAVVCGQPVADDSPKSSLACPGPCPTSSQTRSLFPGGKTPVSGRRLPETSHAQSGLLWPWLVIEFVWLSAHSMG